MDGTQHAFAGHPLDPLAAAEVAATAAVVRAGDAFRERAGGCRFITIALQEPSKEAVLAWEAGGPRPPREAEVVLLDRNRAETVEAVVSLDAGAITAWTVRTGVQPMAVVKELMEAEEVLRLHPEFQAALARRGVTDPGQIQVDAWPAGHFGREEESERRLARGVAFVKPAPGDNEWAHPVDGVIALVDLNTLEVLRVDDHGVVPVPQESGNFDPAAAGRLRTDIAPIEITQPDGPGFTVDGRVVRWQRWQVHVGFTPREGLVLNRVGYEDGGRLRPIMHRASLSEMVVPYGDPSPTHYFKNAFDAGENGVGVSASPLTRGCDCLGEIVYLDAVCNDAAGEPVVIRNAICMHEEDVGVLWRHIEWRDGSGEVRRSRRLVISSFSAIGNYDYGFFWYLYQDGSIEFEVKLTGVLSTGAVAPGVRPEHGVLVAPGLNAMVHQHFFNMRLDLDVDGVENAVEEVWTESLPPGPGNPVGNAFRPMRRRLRDRARGAAAARPGLGPLVGDREPRRPPPAGRAGRLPARAGRERRAVRPARRAGEQAGGIHAPPPVGHAVRARRALRGGRVPEPAPRRRRASGVDARRPARRRTGHRGLVYVRPPPRAPAGGLAGDAGGDHRLHAEAGGVLRPKSRPRRAAA